MPCILIQARVVGGSTLVARVGQKSHFYHTQLVGRGLAAPSQKLHPRLGPYRPIRHHWIIMPLKASFPIFRFPFFLLHFSFPFFRFLFFRFPFFRFPFFRFPSIRIQTVMLQVVLLFCSNGELI